MKWIIEITKDSFSEEEKYMILRYIRKKCNPGEIKGFLCNEDTGEYNER